MTRLLIGSSKIIPVGRTASNPKPIFLAEIIQVTNGCRDCEAQVDKNAHDMH